MPQFSPRHTRLSLTSTLLVLGALGALSVATACTDDIVAPAELPAPPPAAAPRALGLVEVTFRGIGTSGMQAGARPVRPGTLVPTAAARGTAAPGLHLSVSAVPGGDGSIQLEPLFTGSFTHGERGAGGVRYLYATFKVRNAQADATPYTTPRKNLTFLGVAGSGTLSATAISSMERFDGSSADAGLATAFLPTGGVSLNAATGGIEPDHGDVLQVLTESEAAAVLASAPSGVSTVFPYGFVTRCVAHCTTGRTLQERPAPEQFDGLVTFAFKVPLQATSADDPFTISAMFLAVDDDATRVTESLEEQGTGSALAAADSLGTAASITLLGTSTTPVSGHGSRRICRVRTAGTDPASPTATLVAASGCTAGAVSLPSNVIVVDHAAPAGGDGHAWATAYRVLQDALTCVRDSTGPGQPCAGVDEIWVKQGTYYPDEGVGLTDNDPAAHFALVDGVGLYGGFAGAEYARSQRDWTAHPTVLDGNIDQDTTSAGNATIILYAEATSSTVATITRTTTVDGFTVRNGPGSGTPTEVPITLVADGADAECSPTLRHLLVTRNRNGSTTIFAQNGGLAQPILDGVTFSANGAAIPSTGALSIAVDAVSVARPIVVRTTFDGNNAAQGGAVFVQGATGGQVDVLLDDVVFRNNTASSGGGAVSVSGPALVRFANAEFWNNHAGLGLGTGRGGALFLATDAEVVLVNATLAGNSAESDGSGGIEVNDAHALYLENTILWGNSPGQVGVTSSLSPTITAFHSLIQGGCPAGATCTAVLDADPGFVDLFAGALRLGSVSAAVDAGDNALLPSDLIDLDGDGNFTEALPLDLAGRPRIVDWAGDDPVATVDIGAYERQP